MSNLTAIEWLIGNLNEKNLVSTTDENFREYIKVVTQAYEMFYLQITDAYDAGFADGFDDAMHDDEPAYGGAEQYYNETYGGEE